tara:strand:+ start:352 stop:528 length:177 start_codon:yes stop_codon:yes gene_type:complete
MIQTVEKIYSNNVFTSYKITFEDGRIYSVPLDKDNTDYQEILLWVAEGNTITDNGSGE